MDPAGVVIGDVDLRLGKWVNSTWNSGDPIGAKTWYRW